MQKKVQVFSRYVMSSARSSANRRFKLAVLVLCKRGNNNGGRMDKTHRCTEVKVIQ